VDRNDRTGAGDTEDALQPPRLRRINVFDLLDGERELILVHRQSEYRLRLTNNDKLILTK